MFCLFTLAIVIIAVVLDKAAAFLPLQKVYLPKFRSTSLFASLDTVSVRFTNTPSGLDVVVNNVDQNSILLAVADNAGVKLPRACRTGLCGSCTCEIKDPTAEASEWNPRAGYVTIRACSARCVPPEGMPELVVDVGRMRKIKRKVPSESSSPNIEETQHEQEIDPMSRFGDNWETEFKPSWVLAQLQQQETIPYTREGGFNPKEYKKRCMHCNGTGRVICDHCDGEGVMMVGNGEKFMCIRCAGSTTCGCGFCRGSGRIFKKISAEA